MSNTYFHTLYKDFLYEDLESRIRDLHDTLDNSDYVGAYIAAGLASRLLASIHHDLATYAHDEWHEKAGQAEELEQYRDLVIDRLKYDGPLPGDVDFE